MKAIGTMAMILGLAACATGQTDIALLDGPRDGRIWFSPLIVVSDKAPLTPAGAAEPGEQLLAGPLPKPEWFAGRGGRTSLLRLASPGAAAYRVHFDEFHLPTGARLFLYGLDATGNLTGAFGPYAGAGPLGTGEFRSRIVPGAVAVIELQGGEADEWPFHFGRISRIDSQGLAQLREAGDPGLTESEADRKPGYTELHPCVVRGQQEQCQLVDRKLVFEGDIVVGDLDEVDSSKDGHSKSGPRESIGITGAQYRWPSGRIPYAILNTLYTTPNDPVIPDARVVAAVQYWNNNLPGLLVPWTDETDYIMFRRAGGSECSSEHVGKHGRVQYINISEACSFGNIVHEIGHAAGLWHEHTREDRDNYVTILWENIQTDPDMRDQFTKHVNDGDDIGAYDYGSIMHYGRFAFTGNGQATIQTIPAGIPIGQRLALSAGDIAGVKKVQCTYTLDVASITVPYFGGQYDLNVTAPDYCGWTAASGSYWLTIASGASGSGNGRVRMTILPNFFAVPRTATVTIGGRPVAVLQVPGPH
jgi:hypothetical protein